MTSKRKPSTREKLERVGDQLEMARMILDKIVEEMKGEENGK